MSIKHPTGGCPYCDASAGLLVAESVQKDDRFTVMKCSQCNQYSKKNKINGATYPLEDSSNPDSGALLATPN